jgi:hypothetical protein
MLAIPQLIWFVWRALPARKRRLLELIGIEAYTRRHSVYLAVLTGMEWMYTNLTGRQLSAQQQDRVVIFAGFVPLSDDLLDEFNYTPEEIDGLIRMQPQRNIPVEILCLKLFNAGQFEWTPTWAHLAEIQLDSSKQSESELLSLDKIQQLTYDKGGWSVILGWEWITEREGGESLREVGYRLGAYMQLLNDIFDTWKDREAGVQTLATRCDNWDDLKQRWYTTEQRLRNGLFALPYPSRNKQSTWHILLIFSTLAEIALQQLAALPHHQFAQLTRKQLVCDMALWRNRFRFGWLYFYNMLKKM